MLDGLELDPHVILGVKEGCSAVELRDAYHRKSKKHHPDQGGDDWAFKIVVRAYEAMQQLVDRERLVASAREAPDTGRIRPGIHDRGTAPERLVHVEMVWMRYEVGDLLELIADKGDHRNLSGSLEITWPGKDVDASAVGSPLADRILKALNASFDELRHRSHPTGARSEIEDGHFWATLGYNSGQAAYEAFKLFHVGLKARGLGVKQWTRDVTIPRD